MSAPGGTTWTWWAIDNYEGRVPVSYVAMWRDGSVHGSLRETPELWFAREFLEGPIENWAVDFRITHSGLAGTRVVFDSGTERLIWVLTGDYDTERNGYLGRWPD